MARKKQRKISVTVEQEGLLQRLGEQWRRIPKNLRIFMIVAILAGLIVMGLQKWSVKTEQDMLSVVPPNVTMSSTITQYAMVPYKSNIKLHVYDNNRWIVITGKRALEIEKDSPKVKRILYNPNDYIIICDVTNGAQLLYNKHDKTYLVAPLTITATSPVLVLKQDIYAPDQCAITVDKQRNYLIYANGAIAKVNNNFELVTSTIMRSSKKELNKNQNSLMGKYLYTKPGLIRLSGYEIHSNPFGYTIADHIDNDIPGSIGQQTVHVYIIGIDGDDYLVNTPFGVYKTQSPQFFFDRYDQIASDSNDKLYMPTTITSFANINGNVLLSSFNVNKNKFISNIGFQAIAYDQTASIMVGVYYDYVNRNIAYQMFKTDGDDYKLIKTGEIFASDTPLQAWLKYPVIAIKTEKNMIFYNFEKAIQGEALSVSGINSWVVAYPYVFILRGNIIDVYKYQDEGLPKLRVYVTLQTEKNANLHLSSGVVTSTHTFNIIVKDMNNKFGTLMHFKDSHVRGVWQLVNGFCNTNGYCFASNGGNIIVIKDDQRVGLIKTIQPIKSIHDTAGVFNDEPPILIFGCDAEYNKYAKTWCTQDDLKKVKKTLFAFPYSAVIADNYLSIYVWEDWRHIGPFVRFNYHATQAQLTNNKLISTDGNTLLIIKWSQKEGEQ